MKKIIIVFACAFFITASLFAKDISISDKALKAFETTFTEAQNVVWTSSGNIYTVQFTQQGALTFVKYDEQGEFISSRRYYQNAKLPIDIQCKLQKKFAGKTVFGVTEYTIADNVYYFIKLEDATTWTTVKVDNLREMELVDSYNKP